MSRAVKVAKRERTDEALLAPRGGQLVKARFSSQTAAVFCYKDHVQYLEVVCECLCSCVTLNMLKIWLLKLLIAVVIKGQRLLDRK